MKAKKRILIVANFGQGHPLSDHREYKDLFYCIFDQVELFFCSSAHDVLVWIHRNGQPDVLFVELEHSYGKPGSFLEARTDPDCQWTGYRLIKHLREKEQASDLYIAVTSTRQLVDDMSECLFGPGLAFCKPFNPKAFLTYLCAYLDIEPIIKIVLDKPITAYRFVQTT